MNLIFLNGPSSSGKTSLAREIQNMIPGYYLYFGIDAFIDMMPTRSNGLGDTVKCDGFYWQDVELPNGDVGRLVASGEYGKHIEESFRHTSKALLDCGNNLIVDNVIDGSSEMAIWRKIFTRYECCFVGVYCSLETLVKREQERGNRLTGSAAEQFFRTHEGVSYDLKVDTGVNSVEACASLIVDHIVNRNARSPAGGIPDSG